MNLLAMKNKNCYRTWVVVSVRGSPHSPISHVLVSLSSDFPLQGDISATSERVESRHFLIRVWGAVPHVTRHVPQDSHAPHPIAGQWFGHFLLSVWVVFPSHLSLCVPIYRYTTRTLISTFRTTLQLGHSELKILILNSSFYLWE